MVVEVPGEEENWLSFMICFYCTVFTPRLCWEPEGDNEIWFKFAEGLQNTLVDLVGKACFSYFPFSPFPPGTNVICFPHEAWSICCDFVDDQMHRACQLIGAEPMVVEESIGPLTY